MDQIIYQNGEYAETVKLESGNVRLIECARRKNILLYRLEWREGKHEQNAPFYSWEEAEAAFMKKAEIAEAIAAIDAQSVWNR